jgi:hypothetical protein
LATTPDATPDLLRSGTELVTLTTSSVDLGNDTAG